MKYQMKTRYPAPAAVVLKMFADDKFQTGKLDAMGVAQYRVLEYKFDGKQSAIVVERKIPMQAPAVLKKVIGSEITAVNHESWNLTKRSGAVRVDTQGMPIDMSCTVGFADDANGCVAIYDWEIKAKLPLIGGTLEKFVVGDLEKRAADEARAAIGLLPKYR
jgi:hypothetical protein